MTDRSARLTPGGNRESLNVCAAAFRLKRILRVSLGGACGSGKRLEKQALLGSEACRRRIECALVFSASAGPPLRDAVGCVAGARAHLQPNRCGGFPKSSEDFRFNEHRLNGACAVETKMNVPKCPTFRLTDGCALRAKPPPQCGNHDFDENRRAVRQDRGTLPRDHQEKKWREREQSLRGYTESDRIDNSRPGGDKWRHHELPTTRRQRDEIIGNRPGRMAHV